MAEPEHGIEVLLTDIIEVLIQGVSSALNFLLEGNRKICI